MRRSALALTLLLAGCGETHDPVRLMSQCDLDAQRTYASTADMRFELLDGYVITCMRAKGYSWNFADKDCDTQLTRSAVSTKRCFLLSPPS